MVLDKNIYIFVGINGMLVLPAFRQFYSVYKGIP